MHRMPVIALAVEGRSRLFHNTRQHQFQMIPSNINSPFPPFMRNSRFLFNLRISLCNLLILPPHAKKTN